MGIGHIALSYSENEEVEPAELAHSGALKSNYVLGRA